MLSKTAKFFLVTTSLAPALLTLWFIKFSQDWRLQDGWQYLIPTISLTVICWGLLKLSKQRLEKMTITISSIKTADNETLGFMLAYLLPLINSSNLAINGFGLVFAGILFFLVVLTTNAYHFNPLMSLIWQYHFYEVTVADGVTFVLITKKNLPNCKEIQEVVQLSEYMILEV